MAFLPTQKITPFLWFESNGKEAAEYYVSVFPDSEVLSGNSFVTNFKICGQSLATMNGGPHDTFNDAVSFYIHCEDQKEVDYFWDRFIKDGGKESMCGWLQDKYGVRWQIIPEALPRLFGDPDTTKAQKAMQAMMKMKKIIVRDLENAFNS